MSQVLELLVWLVIIAFLAFYVGSLVWGIVQDIRGKRGFDKMPPVALVGLYYVASIGFVLAVAVGVGILLWNLTVAWLK